MYALFFYEDKFDVHPKTTCRIKTLPDCSPAGFSSGEIADGSDYFRTFPITILAEVVVATCHRSRTTWPHARNVTWKSRCSLTYKPIVCHHESSFHNETRMVDYCGRLCICSWKLRSPLPLYQQAFNSGSAPEIKTKGTLGQIFIKRGSKFKARWYC